MDKLSSYLVDYENVNANGLTGIEHLQQKDTVIIFYSNMCDNMTFSTHENMNHSSAKIEFVKVMVGSKNSLDFQLVTYLGYLIARNPKEEYKIVSNDSGFSSVVEFWTVRGIRISMVADLSHKQQDKFLSLEKQISSYLPDEGQSDVDLIIDYLKRYKTKQGFHNALTKKFGSERTHRLL